MTRRALGVGGKRAAMPNRRHCSRGNDRITMMTKWADYLDRLRDGAQVIPIKKA